jgi:hypothetical protein
MSFVWDTIQHFQIEKAREAAGEASAKADSFDSKITSAIQQVERLSLACQALWEIIRDNGGITEEQLHAKILEVDLRDGRVDDRLGPQVIDCPHCHQKTSTRRSQCIFCGGSISGSHIFIR